MRLALHRSVMALVLAFAMAAPIIGQTSTAFACTCEPPNLERQFEAATVVFEGEVESVRAASDGLVRVEFEADEFWKGQPTRHVVLYTANNSAACGMNFNADDDYFVLAYGSERLETNLCQYNVNLDEANDTDIAAIETLGEGQEPDEDDPPSQGSGNGDEPTDDGDGSGGNGGDEPANPPGPEADGDSEVDADPVNLSIVLLSSLVAAGAVVMVAGRK